MSQPKYQLFPDLTDDEFLELTQDIAARGVMVPVEYDEAGNILDGHHREAACRELGIVDFPSIVRYGMTEAEKRLHVRKLNMARRHLTKAQRNEVMREMRAEGNTLQEIADTVGVGVETVRRHSNGTFPNEKVEEPPKLKGRDGKERPATYKPRKSPAVFTETASQREKATAPEVAERVANGSSAPSNRLHLGGAHVGHAGGENEWYTPPEIVEPARKAMGGIDLDPASCKTAQETIRAKRFYSAADDGLAKKWKGRVWMNPPYSRDLCAKFAAKFVEHFEGGDVTQGCVLVNNATETVWLQSLLKHAAAVCFIGGRVRFLDKDGNRGNALQGQVLLYFGPSVLDFQADCRELGPVFFNA
jgi:ParB-like chromosome segregation protein Spo0J